MLQALGIRWIDVGAAALVAVLVELNVVVGGGPGAAPLNTVAYVFGAMLAVPILFRRKWPLRALIGCSVLLLLYYSLDRRNISPAPRPRLRERARPSRAAPDPAPPRTMLTEH